jgi:preprotein translocase subunit YajC
VLTAGGIIGTVVKVEDDNTLLVDIAKDVRVRVARGTISELLGKPQAGAAPGRSEAAPESGAKSGLMSQLFGKK